MKHTSKIIKIAILSAFVGLLVVGPAHAVTCQNKLPASNPDAIYADHGNGTVTDTRTELMWKQCVEGLTEVGCVAGSAEKYTWDGALLHAESSAFSGFTDWRVPNLKELSSLVEECRALPAINDSLFPNTPVYWAPVSSWSCFWTSSPVAGRSNFSWMVGFHDGWTPYFHREYLCHVRLVRGGQ